MVLIKSPNFLILDEPTNDLDIVTLNTLEEFLDVFPGCLIIVSHDRYFMDRLVEHLFVFEGEGHISDFPGNYTDLREWEKTQKSVEKESKATPSPLPEKEVELSASTVKTKPSFKEKQEFEDLNKKLIDLAKEKETLVQLINGGTDDHEQLLEWSVKIQEFDTVIEALELRWLELSELDGIG